MGTTGVRFQSLFVMLLGCVALASGGCPKPTPQALSIDSFSIDNGAATTVDRTVSLVSACSNGPLEYTASESAVFDGAEWQNYAPEVQFTLSAGDGTKTVYFKVRNAMEESPVASASIALQELHEPDPPTVLRFALDDSVATTTEAEVTLANTCSGGPTEYMASESAEFAGAAWQSYDPAPSFTLSEGAGMKTVFFKVRNGQRVSAVVSDQIQRLNPPAPMLLLLCINGGTDSTTSQTVTLNNTCVGHPVEFMASQSPIFAGASWLAYDPAPEFLLSAGTGIKRVYFKTRNAQGESNVLSDEIRVGGPPTIDSFAIDDGRPSTSSCTVTLNNACSSAPAEYIASESENFAGAAWSDYSNAPTFTLTEGDGVKTVYFKTRNTYGESNVASDTLVLSERKTWTRTYGGSKDDHGESIMPTPDGGYVIAGSTCSFGAVNNDMLLLKTDRQGHQLWQKTFGGDGNDYGRSVVLGSDGGYLLAGSTSSGEVASLDIYLMKTDGQGNPVWSTTLGGSKGDLTNYATSTPDGGYIVAGVTNWCDTNPGDAYLLKTDSEGKLLWERTFGGADRDEAMSLARTNDGGYVVVGCSRSFGSNLEDIYLVKTDEDGILLWETTFGAANYDIGAAVTQTSDGGYLLAGNSYSENSISAVTLVKTNDRGGVLWTKHIDRPDNEGVDSMTPASDGGFVLAGGANTLAPTIDSTFYLLKVDSEGESIWSRTFASNLWSWAHCVAPTQDGGYVLAGTTGSMTPDAYDIFVVKTDSQGLVAPEKTLPARR